MGEDFDYIIVGAGSAGCVLASRLSADPAIRVVLLEAGGKDSSMLIHMPAGIGNIIPPDKPNAMNWGFWTVPQRHLNDRPLYWPRGRVLGGSSSINGMVYIRGHASDYDRWAQTGLAGWGWRDVLPYFRRAENSERGACDFHGEGGPLHTSSRRHPLALAEVFVAAAVEAGFARTDDFNGEQFEGAGHYDATIKDGSRWSAARAYLTPVLHRANLEVRTGVQVEAVTFAGRTATGVRYRQGARTETVRARETILSGGAINSPQLLLLSGIGPAADLRALGIEVVRDLAAVGENLQDHLDVVVQWASTQPVTLNANKAFHRKVQALLQWRFGKTGSGASMATPSGAFVSTRPGLAAPDVQLHFMPYKGAPHGRGTMSAEHGYQMHVCQVRPDSRGTIKLASPDPLAHPLIDPNYLTSPDDARVMVEGVKIARRIGAAAAFAPYRGEERWPGAGVTDDAAILARLRDSAETIYHPVGTCRMGADPASVVDGDLRVRGIEGLRVVDASVMPFLVSGNTNAPTIMIAEKASDAIISASKHRLAA